MIVTIKNYTQAKASLKNRDSKIVRNNTKLIRNGNAISVKLHNTIIVTYYPSGMISINTGGWSSNLTADRIGRFTKLCVYKHNNTLKVTLKNNNYCALTITDGMLFTDEGHYVSGGLRCK